MIVNVVLVIVAFAVLIKGADFFVAGASSMARKMGITPFVVGLTVVAIGTSAPEFFVNVIAALGGSTDLAIGNVIGSNVANILLGLGVAATVATIAIKKQTVWKEIPFALLSALVIAFVTLDTVFSSASENVISRGDGLVLLSFFVIFMVYTFGLSKVKESDEESNSIEVYSWPKSLLLTFGGIGALLIGGELVVTNAVAIALALGWSENLIGLTIVAMGTSLPEIVTSVIAVRKKQADLVVGGIIGSTIFNAFFILGSTALVKDVIIAPQKNLDITFDTLFLLVISTAFFIFMFVGKKHSLERWQGVLFITAYLLYMLYAIMREMN